jgi:uncharacterized protein (DUF736 family)
MIIGNFIHDAKANTYAGDITTLSFQRSDVRIVPVKKSTDREPDFRVGSRRSRGGPGWFFPS